MSQEVPIPEKLLLTIKEAAIYSNIGINRIDSMLREDGCPFVLFVGSKKLVKRREFAAWCDRACLIFRIIRKCFLSIEKMKLP